MDTEFGSYLRSPLFTFYVGPDKEPIVVHSGAIASLSSSLKSLVYGPMSESESKSAIFADVDMDTFLRLCQYAYERDYETPPGIDEADVESSETAEPNDSEPVEQPPQAYGEPIYASAHSFGVDPWEWAGPKKKAKKSLTDAMDKLMETLSRDSTRSVERFMPVSNTLAKTNYIPVFMGHSHLYVLADKWGIDGLKSLIIGKLHKTLTSFTLYDSRIKDVLDLVRFIYDDENTQDDDDMKKLVLLYVACKYKEFSKSKEFMALLEEGGKFVSDFWKMVNDYLL